MHTHAHTHTETVLGSFIYTAVPDQSPVGYMFSSSVILPTSLTTPNLEPNSSRAKMYESYCLHLSCTKHLISSFKVDAICPVPFVNPHSSFSAIAFSHIVYFFAITNVLLILVSLKQEAYRGMESHASFLSLSCPTASGGVNGYCSAPLCPSAQVREKTRAFVQSSWRETFR